MKKFIANSIYLIGRYIYLTLVVLCVTTFVTFFGMIIFAIIDHMGLGSIVIHGLLMVGGLIALYIICQILAWLSEWVLKNRTVGKK